MYHPPLFDAMNFSAHWPIEVGYPDLTKKQNEVWVPETRCVGVAPPKVGHIIAKLICPIYHYKWLFSRVVYFTNGLSFSISRF